VVINVVTHELKTPVAPIRMYLQTLQSRAPSSMLVCPENETARPTELAWLSIRRMVDLTGGSWNRVLVWLRQLDGFRRIS
jgi:signal transduction histidine kinase